MACRSRRFIIDRMLIRNQEIHRLIRVLVPFYKKISLGKSTLTEEFIYHLEIAKVDMEEETIERMIENYINRYKGV